MLTFQIEKTKTFFWHYIFAVIIGAVFASCTRSSWGGSGSNLQAPDQPGSSSSSGGGQCSSPQLSNLEPSSVQGSRWQYRNLPVRFGSEFEFPTVYGQGKENDSVPETFVKAVEKMCTSCKSVFTCQFKGKAGSRHIWVSDRKTNRSVQISPTADEAVLEVRTNPMTYVEHLEAAPILHVFIFAVTAEMERQKILISSRTEPNRWSGHVNVSWPGMVWNGETKDFNRRKELGKILRFYVDFQNFPELAMGVLGGDIRNAPPLATFPLKRVAELKKIVQKFEKEESQPIQDILTDVFLNQYDPQFRSLRLLESPRYSSMNLHLLTLNPTAISDQERRIEVRSFYAPKTVAETLAQYRIIQSRLGYLSTLNGNIEVYGRTIPSPQIFRTSGLQDGVTPEAAAQTYIVYLFQGGLDPSEEAQYLVNQQLGQLVRQIWRNHCLPSLRAQNNRIQTSR